MNRSILFTLLIAISPLFNQSLAQPTEKSTCKDFSIPNTTEVKLCMPPDWVSNIAYPPNGLPPTIAIRQNSTNDPYIKITVLRNINDVDDFNNIQDIRNTVIKTGNDFLTAAVETTLPLKALNNGQGYYFSITDKAPKPGDYKYMSQGVMALGKLQLIFTILTNSPGTATLESSLSLIEKAQQNKNLTTATIEDIKATASSLGKDCKLIEGQYPVSIQATTLYPMITDTYSALLTPPEQKSFQSVECSNQKGTIYYYQYAKQTELESARSFIQSLIWGEGGPSKLHPEIIQNVKNVLIVFSSHNPERLQKLVREPQ